MRILFTFMCALALGLVGCSETSGTGGTAGSSGVGGDGGSAGSGGMGGTGGMECFFDYECDDGNQCTENACPAGVCEFPPVEDGTPCDDGNECTADLCSDAECESTPVQDGTACDESNECTVGMCSDGDCDSTTVADGTACGDEAGTCQQGSCKVACTELGIRDAIAAGGGPYTFACADPTTIVTQEEIVIDSEVILDGEGLLTVDGNEEHGVFVLPGGTRAELRGLTVTGGADVATGGGIFSEGDLVLVNSEVRDSAAAEGGGGIWSGGGATLTLIDSTVSGNRAEFGGGIRNTGAWGTLTNSTVSGNTGRQGGGIHGDAAALTLTNSTVSGNSADSGSAIFYENGGDVMLSSSTVSGSIHVSGRTGGPISIVTTATLVDGMCSQGGDGVIWTSNGYNIESPGDTCRFDHQTSDLLEITPDALKLGELADNGGPTETHALLPGSVAIDRIPEAQCLDPDGAPLTTDQRGEPRPGGTMCDVGAFEVQP